MFPSYPIFWKDLSSLQSKSGAPYRISMVICKGHFDDPPSPCLGPCRLLVVVGIDDNPTHVVSSDHSSPDRVVDIRNLSPCLGSVGGIAWWHCHGPSASCWRNPYCDHPWIYGPGADYTRPGRTRIRLSRRRRVRRVLGRAPKSGSARVVRQLF